MIQLAQNYIQICVGYTGSVVLFHAESLCITVGKLHRLPLKNPSEKLDTK